MKHLLVALTAGSFVVASCASARKAAAPARSGVPNHPTKIEYSKLDWQVPLGKPYRRTLDNGLRVYLAEDPSLPLVSVIGYLKYGSIAEPKGKEGIGALLVRLMRTGGTEQYPPDTLDAVLDRYAINASFGLHQTNMVIRFSFLEEFADTAFHLMEQMLFHPVFDKQRLKKERARALANIAHRFDNPGPVLRTAQKKLMYPGEPNSHLSTRESIGSITRDQIVALHKDIMKTENVILGVSGKIGTDDVAQRLESMFPQARDSSTAQFPEIAVGPKVKALFVHKDMTQAYVRMSLPLFTRPHQDYYPMSLLNHILGGGSFTSRLNKSIRSDAGLTYSIYSNAQSNYTFPGLLFVSFHTKTETAARAIRMTHEEIDRLLEEGITDTELANAKQVLIDGLPSMFRSPEDIVEHYAWNEYYGRTEDHFRVYPDKLRAITKDEVMTVARKYLKPEEFSYAVVGDTTALSQHASSGGFSLEDLGPRTTIPTDSLPWVP